MGWDMKWILIIIVITSGSYNPGMEIELLRFYTAEGCLKTRQYIRNLEKRSDRYERYGGEVTISDCFIEVEK